MLTVVIRDPPAMVIMTPLAPIVEVAGVGPPGPIGLTGPEGQTGPAAATMEIIVPAGAIISGHHVVGYDPLGNLVHASNDNPDFFSTVLGVSLNAAVLGDPVTVATNEEIQFSGWAWDLSIPIFLGVNGELTQVPPDLPSANFTLQVGFPTAADKMRVTVGIAIGL